MAHRPCPRAVRAHERIVLRFRAFARTHRRRRRRPWTPAVRPGLPVTAAKGYATRRALPWPLGRKRPLWRSRRSPAITAVSAPAFAKPGHAFPRDTNRLQRPDLAPEGTRTINIVDVSRLLLDDTLDPPIRAVFIYNHNPVATHPDRNRMRRALAREDVFVAGADVVMTDSMRYCDVVLPAASHFEFADIYGAYRHCHLQRAEAVIFPVGESLPNTEIFRRLAARFGFDDPVFRESDEALMDAAFLDDDPRLAGHRPSRWRGWCNESTRRERMAARPGATDARC